VTEDEQLRILEAVRQTREALRLFEGYASHLGTDLETIYQAAKAPHTAALGIWCTVVDILRAQAQLPAKDPSDAINLNELFGEKENECGN
jgi:hypothetical protein